MYLKEPSSIQVKEHSALVLFNVETSKMEVREADMREEEGDSACMWERGRLLVG